MPDHHPGGMAQLSHSPSGGLSTRHPEPATWPEGYADPEPAPAPGDPPPPPRGPRWSRPALLLLRTAALVLACATVWHLGMVFLSVAPANTISEQYQRQIHAYVYPEFEQNWRLFAPNPLDANTAVEVRVQTLAANGRRPQSGWISLTAQDISHIRGNPFPSHAAQNLLFHAWNYYTLWHSWRGDRSLGSGGTLSGEYLKRIALQRIGRDWQGSPITAIQIRSATTSVAGPAWTAAPRYAQTSYATLPWWPVSSPDYEGLGG